MEITQKMLGPALLVAGMIFPTLSLFTWIASLATRRRHGRYASPVFIPIVGPALLTSWVLIGGHSCWLIPVVWLLDMGTVAFLLVFPRLALEWWQFSVFTRLATLRGAHGIEEAVVTLHRGGLYFLKKTWNRRPGELGVLGLGETGTFLDDGESIAMTSHHGLHRTFKRIDLNAYAVTEPGDGRFELQDYSLQGWRLDRR